jgi:hypothetical protein
VAVWSIVKVGNLSPDIRWDAEHYRPEYLQQEREVRKLKTTPLREVADVSDGNHLSIADEFADNGVRYLRGQDLADFFISDADPIFVPENNYIALARSHMFPGDVLVGIVGTIGTVGLVTDRYEKLTGNCKLAIVRSRRLPGEYIAAYLASRVGQYEIKRRVRGAVQMGLILPDLKGIPIVEPTQAQLDCVVSAVQLAQAARQRAAATIAAAEAQLMEALGLDRLDLSPQKCYTRRFRDLQDEGRFDAEYFNPKYQRIMRKLRAGGRILADVAQLADRPFNPALRPKGGIFRYIEIGSLTGDGEAEAKPLDVADAPSRAAWIVKPGDIITSTVRPIRRLSAIMREDQGGCVCSSGFAVMTPTQGPDGIESEVLLTYLRLPIICEILDLHTTASMYPAIPVDRLMRFPITVPDTNTRQALVVKVQEAMSSRREAARRLEQAKATIEDMITQSG